MRQHALMHLFAALALLLLCATARADTQSEIIDRCMLEIGEFGNDAVQMCVQNDTAAAKALAQYPAEARERIAQCTEAMKGGGWSMVKHCVDRAASERDEKR